MEDHRAIQLIQMMEEMCVHMCKVNELLTKIVESGSFRHERVGEISITDFDINRVAPIAVSDARFMSVVNGTLINVSEEDEFAMTGFLADAGDTFAASFDPAQTDLWRERQPDEMTVEETARRVNQTESAAQTQTDTSGAGTS